MDGWICELLSRIIHSHLSLSSVQVNKKRFIFMYFFCHKNLKLKCKIYFTTSVKHYFLLRLCNIIFTYLQGQLRLTPFVYLLCEGLLFCAIKIGVGLSFLCVSQTSHDTLHFLKYMFIPNSLHSHLLVFATASASV